MRAIAAPARDEVQDYRSCVECQRDLQVRARLNSLEKYILCTYQQYDASDLGQLQPAGFDELDGDALRSNYDLLGNGRSMQEIRGAILAASPLNRCVFCSSREATALDHYLPKSQFPEFSVLANNLLPACSTCNQRKGSRLAGKPRFFHAYRDPQINENLLQVNIDIIHKTGVSIEFTYRPSGHFTDAENSNLQFTFMALGLAEHYLSQANLDLTARFGQMETYFDLDGAAGLIRYLVSSAASARAVFGPNYWQVALHQALGENSEFCAGGFLYLRPTFRGYEVAQLM